MPNVRKTKDETIAELRVRIAQLETRVIASYKEGLRDGIAMYSGVTVTPVTPAIVSAETTVPVASETTVTKRDMQYDIEFGTYDTTVKGVTSTNRMLYVRKAHADTVRDPAIMKKFGLVETKFPFGGIRGQVTFRVNNPDVLLYAATEGLAKIVKGTHAPIPADTLI